MIQQPRARPCSGTEPPSSPLTPPVPGAFGSSVPCSHLRGVSLWLEEALSTQHQLAGSGTCVLGGKLQGFNEQIECSVLLLWADFHIDP